MTRCDHKFVDSTSCLKCGWTPDVENPLLPLLVQAHIDVEKLKADCDQYRAAMEQAEATLVALRTRLMVSDDELAERADRVASLGATLVTVRDKLTTLKETLHGRPDGPDTDNGPQNQT